MPPQIVWRAFQSSQAHKHAYESRLKVPVSLSQCLCAGDVNEISIGEDTNVQDGTVIHVAKNNAGGRSLPTIIGDKVTIGDSQPSKVQSITMKCSTYAHFLGHLA